MDSNHKFCSICSKRHISKPSIEWCTECNQAFCTECKECHSLMSISENHMTIPIDRHDELQTSILSINNICENHTEKYELYCQTHDKLLCLTCIEEHSECKDFKSIKKIAKDIKSSESFNEVHMSLEDIDTNIDKMIQEIQSNHNSTKDCPRMILQQICEIREKVNMHLDMLEKRLKDELSELANKAENDMQVTIKSLEETKFQNTRKQKKMEDFINYASDLQTFIGLRHLSCEVITDEAFLRSLQENGSLDKVKIVLELDDNITSFSNVINTLGSFQLQKIPGNFCLESQADKKAQTTGKTKSIGDIGVKLLNTIDTKGDSIMGCDFLPDSKMVFSNYSMPSNTDFIVVIDSNGSLLSKISVDPNYAFDVAALDEKNVVVTSPKTNDPRIIFIDIYSKAVTKIETECICESMTFINGNFLSISPEKGIRNINAKNGRIMSTIDNCLPNFASITSLKSKIYFCDPVKNVISCCNMVGTTIWSFTDDTIIKKPQGIAVDGMGNAYVTNQDLNNVIVISPDGNQSKLLLSQSDGLENPKAIQYDRKRDRLLVANKTMKAFLFDISH